MNALTPEEKAFLEKMDKQREKHKEAQAKYREKNRNKMNEYNKTYQENQRLIKAEIMNKISKVEPPTPEYIDVEEISNIDKIDRRTRQGKKRAQQPEIKPSYETRKEPLTKTTINDYLRKADILNRLFNNRTLPQETKSEITKLLNDNKELDKTKIFKEMSFIINDIDNTINIIRQSYIKDSSFKSYINVLAVIASHFKQYKKQYLIYSKLGKTTNKEVQEVRENNQLADDEKDKIINVGEQEYNKNVDKLNNNQDDILIYALYLLFPARRLDYRNMKITNEKDINQLNDINFLLIDGNKQTFIFNEYKTDSTYNKQVFEVPKELNAIISKYIYIKQLKAGDYLISLERNKKEIISQGNFSAKISNVFQKIYNVPISVRFIRMSWASDLYSKNPTAKQIKDISFKMSHSPSESRLYNKVFNIT